MSAPARILDRLVLLGSLFLVAGGVASAVPLQFQGDYDRGYGVGYQSGYASGVVTGTWEGRTAGKKAGDEKGYDDGYTETYAPSFERAYAEQLPVGQAHGYTLGFAETFASSYQGAIEWFNRPPVTGGFSTISGVNTSMSINWGGLGGWTGHFGGTYGDWDPTGATFGIDYIDYMVFQQDAAYYYDEGHSEGDKVGRSEGYTVSYQPAYNSAYETAYTPALERGRATGVIEGTATGASEGFDAGWWEGQRGGDQDGSALAWDLAYSDWLAGTVIESDQLFAAGWWYANQVAAPLWDALPSASPADALAIIPEPASLVVALSVAPLTLGRRRRG